jgi:carboxylesterase type B
VKGHAAPTYNEVSEYLGIPYVAPPVASLRWMAPQKAIKSNNTFTASKYGPDCPALYSAVRNSSNAQATGIQSVLSQVGHVQDEDCLTANIWTKPQTGEKKKAVLVCSALHTG